MRGNEMMREKETGEEEKGEGMVVGGREMG
jgi:hypothetical protein